ncbi:MAG: hypothetical protein ACRC7B_00430, partial [Metamycoplasmataceae bacterium]
EIDIDSSCIWSIVNSPDLEKRFFEFDKNDNIDKNFQKEKILFVIKGNNKLQKINKKQLRSYLNIQNIAKFSTKKDATDEVNKIINDLKSFFNRLK